jgi:CopG family nickel-responsive transcriptional regulator
VQKLKIKNTRQQKAIHREEEMTELARFGISIDQSLLDNFDQMITTKGYDNRSEAIRDMIRGALVEDQVENADTTPTVGTVTLGL